MINLVNMNLKLNHENNSAFTDKKNFNRTQNAIFYNQEKSKSGFKAFKQAFCHQVNFLMTEIAQISSKVDCSSIAYLTTSEINLFEMNLFILLCLLFLTVLETTSQFITVVNSTKTYASVQPTWLTSPYFRAGNQAVITTLTGNSSTPTFPFIFSSPLTGIPSLAYGIKNYRGNDYMGQQFYEIKMIGLTQATFTVQIQIYGITNLWLLAVAYLAVEPTFPHHFNTFDNVPLNYSSGPIVNISTKATELRYFTEYINYTQQAALRTYKTFTNPLSSNIIVLFMTSLWIRGTFYVYPVKFHITPQVINSQIYSLNATLQTQVLITNVHFSQVIFNTLDIQNSNRYQVVYYQWDNDMNGGWRSLPSEFVDNFIMGVTAFETVDAACGFQYQWEFSINSGVFGVEILRSWTLTNTCGFSYSQTSVLYISTWLCPPPYIYFNISTQLCQDMCGGYYLQNANTSTCVQCTNPMCYTCESSNSSYCIECATFDHMLWVNGTCQCFSGYFYLTGKCVTCQSQNPGCLDCSYGVVTTTQPFNSSDFQCHSCNQTQNYFLSNDFCVKCTISNCATCSSLASCQICDTGFSVEYSLRCSTCAVLGCFTCIPSDNYKCATCYTAGGFYLVAATQQCTSNCGDGLTAIGMEGCDDGNNNDGDGCSSICILQPFFNCTILANFTTVCLPVCGDGIQKGGQACDDGNLIDKDGCSQLCKIEIVIALKSQIRNLDYCNSLKFGFTVLPYATILDTLNFTSFMVFNSTSLINPVFSYSQQKSLSFSYDFIQDMVSQYLQITENTTISLQYSSYTFSFNPNIFKIDPQNNVAANYLQESMCNQKKIYEKSYQVLEIASYAILLLSMLPGKIIGLELFGVLQLAYFSVGSIDSVNVLLSPLMNMKGLNGYSQPISHSNSEDLPRRVKEIRHYPSFLDNFNVMFLLMFIQLFVGLILYALAKLTIIQNKTLSKIANRLVKQIFLTIVLFNCFNISYSFAIYFRYSSESLDSLNIVISIMSLAALVIMSFFVTYLNPQGFGQFKQKFKEGIVQNSYMAISILYRTSVGFLLAYSNDDDLSTLFALGISLMFLLYNLVNLPFDKAYHNYRACICHLTQFITLFVAMYYRSMKSTTSPTVVASIFSPAKIQFFLLFICLFVSIAVLIYDTYVYVKRLCISNKVESDERPKDLQEEEQSQENVMVNQLIRTQSDIFGLNNSINPSKAQGS